MLERTYGIPHEVLNAKYHEKEAQIVAKAGQQHDGPDGKLKGNVTIATNMAGRGTDIKLGPGVVWPNCFGPWDLAKQVIPSDFGNKCCVGCTGVRRRRPTAPTASSRRSTRPSRSAAGPSAPPIRRAACTSSAPSGTRPAASTTSCAAAPGRQGDPGSSRFFLSLEDDLMRIFARDWVSAGPPETGHGRGHGPRAPVAVARHRERPEEGRGAELRHPQAPAGIRRGHGPAAEDLLRPAAADPGVRRTSAPLVWDLLAESVEAACDNYLSEAYSYETVAEWARRNLAIQVEADQLKGKTAEEIVDFLQDRAVLAGHDAIEETLGEFIPEELDELGDELEEPESREEDEERDRGRGRRRRPITGRWRRGPRRASASGSRESELKKLSRSEIQDTLGKASDKRDRGRRLLADRGVPGPGLPPGGPRRTGPTRSSTSAWRPPTSSSKTRDQVADALLGAPRETLRREGTDLPDRVGHRGVHRRADGPDAAELRRPGGVGLAVLPDRGSGRRPPPPRRRARSGGACSRWPASSSSRTACGSTVAEGLTVPPARRRPRLRPTPGGPCRSGPRNA